MCICVLQEHGQIDEFVSHLLKVGLVGNHSPLSYSFRNYVVSCAVPLLHAHAHTGRETETLLVAGDRCVRVRVCACGCVLLYWLAHPPTHSPTRWLLHCVLSRRQHLNTISLWPMRMLFPVVKYRPSDRRRRFGTRALYDYAGKPGLFWTFIARCQCLWFGGKS